MGKYRNYFEDMIQRYETEDFVPKLKPEQIQKSAKERIFREMVKGKIDYGVHGNYFLDAKFLENLCIAADNELLNKTTIRDALCFYDMTFPGQGSVIHNKAIFENLCIVYKCLNDKLQWLKFGGNVGVLTDIPYILANYRNSI